MPDLSLKPLPPAEAIKYFRGKGLQRTFAWQDMWQEEHAKAFTVAKAMRYSVLQDIRDAVDKAITLGTTLQTFQKELRPKLEDAGWWGKQPALDDLTGELVEAQLGSPRRLRVIFDTNMRTAYAAGRWERIEETKEALEYLRYETAGDDRVRPEHAAWDGTTLPVDDDWWDEHNPPCDWGCRCTVVQVSAAELARDGKGPSDTPTPFPSRSWTNPRTGEVVRVEGGIGPGWGYNVGKAYLERDTPSPMGPPDEGDEGASAMAAADGTSALQEDFLSGFGASPKKTVFYPDKTGDGLVIGPGLFKNSVGRRALVAWHDDLPLIGRALRDPDKVERVWRFGPGGDSLLVRRYTARIDGRDVTVDWCAQGWWASAA